MGNEFYSFLAALGLLFVGHFLRVERWKILLKPYSSARTSVFFVSLTLGYLINIFLPFRAGELFRSYIFSRLSGCKTSYVISSVFVERYSDILVIFLIALIAKLVTGGSVLDPGLGGLLLAGVLLTMIGALILVRNRKLGQLTVNLASLFNDSLKSAILNFHWTLYRFLKSLQGRQPYFRYLSITIVMWASYFLSTYFLWLAVAPQNTISLTQILSLIYLTGIFQSQLATMFVNWSNYQTVFFAVLGYFCAPPLFTVIYLFVSKKVKLSLSTLVPALNWHLEADSPRRIQIYSNRDDQISFLSRYFVDGSENLERQYALNRNVTVIKDISSGSNASTWVIHADNVTKIRKFAFDADVVALKLQVDWLNHARALVPVTDIMNTIDVDGCFAYDMSYSPTSISFFETIHTLPADRVKLLLAEIVEAVEGRLHQSKAEATDEIVASYIQEKLIRNIELVKAALPTLFDQESLVINGKSYRNIQFFEGADYTRRFMNSLSQRKISRIHGDLTIENIIIRTDRLAGDNDWYLIDPNPNNIFNSPLIDFAKLFQSLNLGYEFLNRTQLRGEDPKQLIFPVFKSQRYDDLMNQLYQRCGGIKSQMVREIRIHEIINYARLLPYKVRKDSFNAPLFYGAFLILINQYWDDYET